MVSIIETGKHNYLPLNDFVRIGQFMGWNLGTMDRLYRYWDRSFEIERYRVKLDFIMVSAGHDFFHQHGFLYKIYISNYLLLDIHHLCN